MGQRDQDNEFENHEVNPHHRRRAGRSPLALPLGGSHAAGRPASPAAEAGTGSVRSVRSAPTTGTSASAVPGVSRPWCASCHGPGEGLRSEISRSRAGRNLFGAQVEALRGGSSSSTAATTGVRAIPVTRHGDPGRSFLARRPSAKLSRQRSVAANGVPKGAAGPLG